MSEKVMTKRIESLLRRVTASENRERRLLDALQKLGDVAAMHAGAGIEGATWRAFAKAIRDIDPDADQ